MFKIMMYAGEWSTLYVSSHADLKMQNFQPRSAHSVGVEKDYNIERLVWRSGYVVGGQAVMLLVADSALTTHCVRSALREQKSELETICNTDDETTSDVLWLSVENTCRIIDRIGPITAKQTASPRLLRAASVVAAASFLLTASLFLTQDFAPWRTKSANGSGGIALWSSATAKRLDDVARRVSRLDEDLSTATKELAAIRNGKTTESPVRITGEKPVGMTNTPPEATKTAKLNEEAIATPISKAKESIEALPVFDLPVDLNYIQAFHHDIRLRPSPAAKSLDVVFETPVIDMTNFQDRPIRVVCRITSAKGDVIREGPVTMKLEMLNAAKKLGRLTAETGAIDITKVADRSTLIVTLINEKINRSGYNPLSTTLFATPTVQ